MNENTNNWKEWPILFIAVAIIFIALTYTAWAGLVEMERMWSLKEEYGYAYMIPIISLYFIWQRRYLVINEKFQFSVTGLLFVLLGFFVLLMGMLSATFSIIQYGFLLSLVASVWMLIGWHAFKVILGPLLLLFLIVPLPAFLFNSLSAYLQLVSSGIGVWVIRLFGISVFLEGNVIDLGVYKLQVVEACSGLRYLFPLFSLSMIAAFIFKAELWKRIIIVISSLPITVFMNSFRIGAIGILVEYGGIEQAEGFLHDFEGWIIFMACTALLVFEMWILLKIGKTKTSLADAFSIDEVLIPDEPYKNNIGTIAKYHIAAAMCIGLLVFSINMIDEKEGVTPDRESFASFPLVIDDWKGRQETLESRVLEALKLDDYFIADYVNDSSNVVNFYMAYYANQQAGEAAHSPKSCIPGGGWKISDFKTINIEDVKIGGESLIANRLLIRKGDYGQLVYYWFDQRGRNITNEYMVKWYLFWDSLSSGRTDGALVRLTTELKPGDDVTEADERLTQFVRLIQPTLSNYIPE
ncbi:MAG: VPLPA-CTERM-specific exosortase XrtD [Gammaproteobacteria bacterium]|nr:VPLPA-CTERM-specific exosortase XrtD [Gammaproteobacteria bacterium]